MMVRNDVQPNHELPLMVTSLILQEYFTVIYANTSKDDTSHALNSVHGKNAVQISFHQYLFEEKSSQMAGQCTVDFDRQKPVR